MPQNKKPPGRAVGHRPQSMVALVPRVDRRLDPPPGLAKHAKDIWNKFWQSEVSNAIDPNADADKLFRWIMAVDEYHRCLKVFRKARLVKGSTGQPALNPLASYIAQKESTIEKAEASLGLGPMERMKLGIAVAGAQLSIEEMNKRINANPDETEDPRLLEAAADTGS